MSAYDWDLEASNQQHREHRHHQQQQQQQQQLQRGFAVEELPLEGKGGKRSRQTYSKYQTAVLETVFQTSKYIVRSKRQQMSAELNLTERQIKIWFQNRRMKEKKCRKEVRPPPHIDLRRSGDCPTVTTPTTNGYEDQFAVEPTAGGYFAVPTTNNNVIPRAGDDAFANYDPRGVKPRRDGGDSFTGYDSLELDPYVAKQQWPPAVVENDFRLDFYGEQHHGDLDHFHEMPTAHHLHRPLNSQVPNYCPPQLQAAHGY